jgi:hypothetical protein
MKSKLLVLILLAGSTAAFAGPRIFFGVNVGGYYPRPVAVYSAPPPPPAAYGYVPVAPGPGYSWISGYYYPVGPRWGWRPGYWARPPYARAYWVGPRYYGGRYYRGYWGRR